MKHILRYQLPVFVWALVIYVASSIPSRSIPRLPVGSDKIIHATIFLVLCWLAHRALRFQQNPLLAKLSLFFAIALTIVYGVTDEYHQLFVPGRSADLRDLLADAGGGLIYTMAFVVAQGWKRRRWRQKAV